MTKTIAMWTAYAVTIAVQNIAGGTPKNAKMIEGWLKAKAGLEGNLEDAVKEIQNTTIAPNTPAEEIEKLLGDKESRGWTSFKVDENGLYIESRQVKALLKEAANILKDRLGRSAFKSKVAERLFVHGLQNADKLYLMTAGDYIKEPTSNEERPIQVMTMQGPRTSLKKVDLVESCTITFRLSILEEHDAKNQVKLEEIAELLSYGQTNGLGADRSQGRGQFVVTDIESCEPQPLPTANDLLVKFRIAKPVNVDSTLGQAAG